MMNMSTVTSKVANISDDFSEEEDSFHLEQPRGANLLPFNRSIGLHSGSLNSSLLMDIVGENQQPPVSAPSLESISPIAKRHRTQQMDSGDAALEGKGDAIGFHSDTKQKRKKQTSTPMTSSFKRETKTPQVSSVVFETPETSEFGAGESSRFVDSREIVAESVVDSEEEDLDDNDCEQHIVAVDEAQAVDCSFTWLFDETKPSTKL